MTGAGGRRDDGESDGGTNVLHGDVSGSVVQAGPVIGGIHQHFYFSGSAGPVVAGSAGTRDQDPEADRHWGPRARGVMSNAETGQRFRGRETALREIIAWLDRPASDHRVLIVTGSPGAGKSAVLSRIVVTAHHATHDSPADHGQTGDDGPRACAGSVACAVHAKGKTALDVAREIARAASAPMGDRPEDLPTALRKVLEAQPDRRFNLIIDALDEASDPAQVRMIAHDVILPIAENCADVGAQVAVGTRRFDGDGDLLDIFAPGATVIDLDDAAYFAVADLAAYALATLQLSGAERPNNPYKHDAVTGPVACRIAELAGKNFLIAGLVARTHGLYDEDAVLVDEIRFDPRVGHVLKEFLRRLSPVEGVAAADLLAALAYVQAPGVPLGLWQAAVSVLTGQTVRDEALWQFARASAANFLIETTDTTTATGSVFRLFHQALNDALLHRVPPGGEAKVTKAFIACGRDLGWDHAPAYLLRSLPEHAARVGLIDELLTDPDYTLYADLRRLITAATAATTEAAERTVRLLRRTSDAVDAAPTQRVALFSVTEVLDSTDITDRHHTGPVPYRGIWADVTPRVEHTILAGHASRGLEVFAVRLDGRDLLATGGYDGTVRIWDPSTGTPRELTGYSDIVFAACAVRVDGRELLATGGRRGVRIWDIGTCTGVHDFDGYTDQVNVMCVVRVDGRELLATGGTTGRVRIWDPSTGTLLRELTGHSDTVFVACAVQVNGRELLATCGEDSIVRIWDPTTDADLHHLNGHTGAVRAACVVRVEGRELLATGGHDGRDLFLDPATGTTPCGRVRIWDPATGTPLHELSGDTGAVIAVCVVRVNGRELLATSDYDGMVRISDPATGIDLRHFYAHPGAVCGVCAIAVDGQDLLVTAGYDKMVRIWDPANGTELGVLIDDFLAEGSVCAIGLDGRDLLVTGGYGRVQIWDPATGSSLCELTGHTGAVNGVCAVRVDGRDLLATGGDDCTVRLWDPVTGIQLVRIPTYAYVCTVVSITTSLMVGLNTGLLAIDLSADIA